MACCSDLVCADPITEMEIRDCGWGYSGTNSNPPHSWGNIYPHASRSRQSPVKIDNINVVRDYTLRKKLDLQMNGNLFNSQTVIRTPHHFAIKVDGSAYIRGGPLRQNYLYKLGLVQFHCDENGGSEHIIDNQRPPVECHLTFYNTKYFSLPEAVNYPDGLVILAIFFNTGHGSQIIHKIIKAYYALDISRYSYQIFNNATLDLKYLIPNNINDYYCYLGSMTTPPCAESVTWIILKEPMTMGRDQLEELVNIHRNRGCCQNGSTVRPTQPLNGRLIRSSLAVDSRFCYK